MDQSSLLLDTPQAVIKLAKKLAQEQQQLLRATETFDSLTARLEEAESTMYARTKSLKDFEKIYVLECCLALEQLLAEDGKGWCPISKELVPFEGFMSGYTSTSEYIQGHWSGSEYAEHYVDAYTQTTNYYFRVPHQCRCGLHFDEVESVCKWQANTSNRYGGTIADAPADIFALFGIPPFDAELLERARPGVFDFVKL